MNRAMSIEEVAELYAKEPCILLVEDDPGVVAYMKRVMSRFCLKLEVATNRAEAEAEMDSETFDMVILDLVIPDVSKPDLLRLVAEKTRCPVMVFSGNLDEHAITTAISILNRPIWFVEKPVHFTTDDFLKGFNSFNLHVCVRGKSQAPAAP